MSWQLLLRAVFYENILGAGRVLEVSDIHANLAFIFPIFIIIQPRMEQTLGFGIGLSTLLGRNYYEYSKILPFNSSTLPEIGAGKNWRGLFLFDYELVLRVSKHITYNLGARFFTSSPFNSSVSGYQSTQGTGLAFKMGMGYRFKKKS